jgi:integrase
MLVSTNKIEDLQLYCIILVSIHLFLRHDEFSNIKVEDIQRDLSILKEGVVEIRLCGKTDKIWRALVLWRKDDVPEFCPILVYVHLAKIQTRYLFPNPRKKQEKQEYNGLLKLLKDRFGIILDRDQNITTHTFRNTDYLFASWGGADMDTTMKSASHLNQATAAAVYMQDAKFQLDYAAVHDPNARFQVPRFRMSIIVEDEQMSYHYSIQCLYSLPQKFVE